MLASDEVTLVFPGRFGSPDPQIPLSLLYIAGALIEKGFKARIIDMRVENFKYLKVDDSLFIGISCMSGPQIKYGLNFAKMVRESDPSCPIVWGGVHPSILPEQTIANDYVDIVVRGEGEKTAVALAERVSSGSSLEGLKGITYKQNGEIKQSPDSELLNLDLLPMELPFNLIKIEKYPSLRQGRFHIQTSRGCPHRCTFCYNAACNRCRWRGKTPTRVLDEMEIALKLFKNIKIFDIIDDNYFVDKKRVEEICEGIIERDFGICWRADCRFDYMSQYEREFLSLLERSGCVELNFGAETGSKRLLASIKKDISPEQMTTSMKKMKEWAPGIAPFVFWMSGFPTETLDDLKDTFMLMDSLSNINPKEQNIEVFIYTPYPSPMLESLPPQYYPPKSLEEWGEEDIFHFKPPWHTKDYVDLLRNVSMVTRYVFYPEDRIKEQSYFYMTWYKMVNKIAKYRWKHRKFNHPFELKIVDAVAKKVRGY